MKINPINNTKNTYNAPQIKHKVNTNQVIKELPLSNTCYKPIFKGNNNNYNITIQGILNDPSIEEETKNKLKDLLEIEYFEMAAIGMKRKDVMNMVSNAMFFQPVYEDVLKGAYVVFFPNSKVEKPLIDLKSIAQYNEKHIERPTNLNKEINENWLTTNFLIAMKQKKLSKLNIPLRLTTKLNGEDVQCLIKYNPPPKTHSSQTRKINYNQTPSLEAQNLKYAPTPQCAYALLKDEYVHSKFKQKVYELGDIPYFNATTQNTSKMDLFKIVLLRNQYPEIFNKLISGEIKYVEGTSGYDAEKLIDLRKLAIEGKDLSTILNENLFAYDICEDISEIKRAYPNAELFFYKLIDEESVLCFVEEQGQSISIFTNTNELKPSILEKLINSPNNQIGIFNIN